MTDRDDTGASAEAPSAFEGRGGGGRGRGLVALFFALLAPEERFAGIRAWLPPMLDGSRDKLFWFLCGWLGGPNRYIERFGHPRLRARHLPFPIATAERDQWLLCMAEAMADVGVPQPLFDRLLESFAGTADWMRNRAG